MSGAFGRLRTVAWQPGSLLLKATVAREPCSEALKV